jgi:phosphoribosyl 1,2-cyclic phosphodiesterase
VLTVRALQSGSSGNAYLVETDEIALLLDAGLSCLRLERYLEELRIEPARLGGIVLTHEHSDHTHGVCTIAGKYGLPIYATPGTLAQLRLEDQECDVVPVAPERPFHLGDVSLTPFLVQHDAAEPVGLLVEHGGTRVALATDLGTVDDRTMDWLAMAELLILEANHDWDRLWRGPYPMMLKRRIAGDRGHLSNAQAAACASRCAERGRMRWLWLAHLSETNNTQKSARETVGARLSGGAVSVGCLRRRGPSLTWRSTEAYVQTRLF